MRHGYVVRRRKFGGFDNNRDQVVKFLPSGGTIIVVETSKFQMCAQIVLMKWVRQIGGQGWLLDIFETLGSRNSGRTSLKGAWTFSVSFLPRHLGWQLDLQQEQKYESSL